MLADVQCPVVVVPDNFKTPDKIVLLYDGSPSSIYVVLGAYKRSKFSRWFKHSLADVLMNGLDKPLFIAHY